MRSTCTPPPSEQATYQEAEKDRRRAGEKLARAYLANAQAGAKQVKEAQNETSDFIYRMARRLEEEKQKKLDILRHMAVSCLMELCTLGEVGDRWPLGIPGVHGGGRSAIILKTRKQ